MDKAVREAKQQTSWIQQNKEFEDALKLFIDRIFDSTEFVSELDGFVAQILLPGRINSLTQTLLKCAAPGVPDAYQGSELWDLRLVDPDNRGPVDYEIRRSMLAELQAGMPVDEIVKRMDSGMPKLWIIHQALTIRRRHPEWFDERSSYTPLPASGSKAMHVIAFLRAGSVAAIVPRWNVRLGGGLGTTTVELPQTRWKRSADSRNIEWGSSSSMGLLPAIPGRRIDQEWGDRTSVGIWAPFAKRLAVRVNGKIHLMDGLDPHWLLAGHAADANFRRTMDSSLTKDPTLYPDPRSQQQPNGVHGASRLYDQTAFAWTDARFQAPPLASGVIYELHIAVAHSGTFHYGDRQT